MAAKSDEFRAEQRVQTVCLLILAMIALGLVMYMLRPVLLPFVLALFFTYCLTPVIDVQTRRLGLPRGVAIVDTAILGLLLLALVGAVVAISVGSMSQQDFAAYQEQFEKLFSRIARSLPLERLGIGEDWQSSPLFAAPEKTISVAISAVLSEVTSVVSNGALVVIFMVFILSGHHGRRRRSALLSEIENRVKRYIIQTVLFSGGTGLAVGMALAALGVRFAWVFGLLTFLLNFIPSIGSIIATLLPLPVILLSPELSLTAKILAVAIPAAIQFVIGNLIQPKVQGASLELHPVVVLMSLLFFGMIWGMVGAFLATPITAVIKIVLERIPVTQPLAAVMAGNLDVLLRRTEPADQGLGIGD